MTDIHHTHLYCVVFRIPFSISLWRCATSQSSLLNIPEQYCLSWGMWLAACHAEPINAKLSRAKVKAAHESSELHPNFIYSFIIWYSLPILLQRDIINPVNYDFKRICDKKQVGTLLIYPIKLCCWEVRYAITSPFYNSIWNLTEEPIKQHHTTSNACDIYTVTITLTVFVSIDIFILRFVVCYWPIEQTIIGLDIRCDVLKVCWS